MKMNAAEKLYVVSLLLVGEKNAIKIDELRSKTHYKSDRDLKAEIERERNLGAIILANAHGYFLPEVDEAGELTLQGYAATKRWYRQQMAKAHGTQKSAESAGTAIAKYALKNFSLFDGEGN